MLSVNLLEHDGTVTVLGAGQTSVRFFFSFGDKEAIPGTPVFGFLPLAEGQIFLSVREGRLHRPNIQNEMSNVAFSHYINKLEKKNHELYNRAAIEKVLLHLSLDTSS